MTMTFVLIDFMTNRDLRLYNPIVFSRDIRLSYANYFLPAVVFA